MKTISCIRTCVAGVALFFLAGCTATADKAASEQAVTSFHQMLDNDQSDAIYSNAAGELKKATSHSDWMALLGAVHRKLGASKTSAEKSWRLNYFNGAEYIILQYSTQYTSGDAVEEFTFHMQDGKPLLAGYHINSNALIIN